MSALLTKICDRHTHTQWIEGGLTNFSARNKNTHVSLPSKSLTTHWDLTKFFAFHTPTHRQPSVFVISERPLRSIDLTPAMSKMEESEPLFLCAKSWWLLYISLSYKVTLSMLDRTKKVADRSILLFAEYGGRHDGGLDRHVYGGASTKNFVFEWSNSQSSIHEIIFSSQTETAIQACQVGGWFG